ncbi:hypothetical protein MC378_10500 [Polaribacter sp. MSW13]|uniref:Baseplate structural protein Gp10 C-terminal domain-containing protein n=1 Tax=Polaribacter marinus TaxID=2916838 RepID=A0A9X1VPU0_9FLAO|nr:hypothetical protein [Polaribacter marinus]MCI2229598.1 hypothetical protein [Polaribacter marinus]
MKYLDIMEEGGYPFDDISIAYLQKMHDDRDSFIYSVFGDLKIVAGVVLDIITNTYSDGLISANGKLYHFVGGEPSAKISKQTIETKRQYEDGNEKKAFINEFYEFGESGTDVIDFSELKRWYQNQPILKEIKEVAGTVTNQSLEGTGWYVADGQNETDDLRSLFIVGFDKRDPDYNVIGKTGGEKKHTLTIQELPAHSHKAKSDGGSTDVNGTSFREESQTTGELETEKTGENTPHENRPPYYVAIRIQFIGL